jgi:hypothetical protein
MALCQSYYLEKKEAISLGSLSNDKRTERPALAERLRAKAESK